jgi:hypothetical protein
VEGGNLRNSGGEREDFINRNSNLVEGGKILPPILGRNKCKKYFFLIGRTSPACSNLTLDNFLLTSFFQLHLLPVRTCLFTSSLFSYIQPKCLLNF